MEAAKEEGGLLNTIRPPRLEDAGLEDCALSHESIKEAFFKAANSLRSLAGTDVESDSDDHCIEDKTLPPNNGGLSDSLIGVAPTSDPPASCSNEKGTKFSVMRSVLVGMVT
ncbi:hypothetical protein BVC80_59g52 [Macleaya cordata]|uniref:Uncharacterized protein n=1 Tax=Macleaya cordata TaxID=56857 RepID=A0A200QJJ2_MACCD|nr:hypothetical protein BVC80_59g52 [Macleaya cordata]